MTGSFGNLQAQWGTQNQFWAWVDANGNIYASDSMSGARQIGVSIEKYKQMESLANEATAKAEDYHDRLVKAGLIVVPPTPEERIAQLSAQVERLTRIVEGQNTQANVPVTAPEILTDEGTGNGHSGNSEGDASKRQPVAGSTGSSTATGVPASAVPVGSGAANGTVRKIEARRG